MLQLIDVSAGYGRNKVLSHLRLDFPKGLISVFIGLNGSGKSTLLKTILGLIPPLEGEIYISGINSKNLSLADRAEKISLLDSQNQIAFPMCLRELLAISQMRNKNPDIKRTALALCDLVGREEKNILEMSSGERQRAFIAHALCANSEVIMLDEPFAHLDWKHQRNLCHGLLEWRKKYGTTFVLAAHELEWVTQLADLVFVLADGEVFMQGDPQTIFNSTRLGEVFDFQSRIDDNPLDGSRRLTLGKRHHGSNP